MPLIPSGEVACLRDLVDQHLLDGSDEIAWRESWDSDLVKAVEDQLRERHLQTKPELTSKACNMSGKRLSFSQENFSDFAASPELVSTQHYHSAGPQKEWDLNLLQYSGLCLCPIRENSHWHNCNQPRGLLLGTGDSYTHTPYQLGVCPQLIGGYCSEDEATEQWVDGILSRLLLQLGQSEVAHWLVLDGPLSPSFIDTITSLVSGETTSAISDEFKLSISLFR